MNVPSGHGTNTESLLSFSLNPEAKSAAINLSLRYSEDSSTKTPPVSELTGFLGQSKKKKLFTKGMKYSWLHLKNSRLEKMCSKIRLPWPYKDPRTVNYHQTFLYSSLVIFVNLLHLFSSLFLYGPLSSFKCFAILVTYHFQVSFNSKVISSLDKINQYNKNELLWGIFAKSTTSSILYR